MNEIFIFLSRSKAFLTFAVLEIFALWCVYRFNVHKTAVMFNTTSSLVAWTSGVQSNALRYTTLNATNKDLVAENLRLNQQLAMLQNKVKADSALVELDSSVAGRYSLMYAEAISHTTQLRNNYITINKGSKDGVEVGMGVISPQGVVGKVKLVKENLSLVSSILHTDNLVSSQVKGKNVLGSTKWDGFSPRSADLMYIDIFEKIKTGDTIVSSSLNAIYPKNIPIGFVRKVNKDKNLKYLEIKLDLAVDFKNLTYLYIIKNKLEPQQTALQEEFLNVKK